MNLHWRIVWRVRQTRSKLFDEFSLSLWMSPFTFSYFDNFRFKKWCIFLSKSFKNKNENVPWMISVSAIVPRFLVRIFVLIDANFSEVNLSETASMCSREMTVWLISLLCFSCFMKVLRISRPWEYDSYYMTKRMKIWYQCLMELPFQEGFSIFPIVPRQHWCPSFPMHLVLPISRKLHKLSAVNIFLK